MRGNKKRRDTDYILAPSPQAVRKVSIQEISELEISDSSNRLVAKGFAFKTALGTESKDTEHLDSLFSTEVNMDVLLPSPRAEVNRPKKALGKLQNKVQGSSEFAYRQKFTPYKPGMLGSSFSWDTNEETSQRRAAQNSPPTKVEKGVLSTVYRTVACGWLELFALFCSMLVILILIFAAKGLFVFIEIPESIPSLEVLLHADFFTL